MNKRLIAQFLGPKDTIATCRFQTEGEISRLAVRDSPYWHHLLVGRHIGIHRPDGGHCNWTARILTRDRRYIQKCLGPALDLGRGLGSRLIDRQSQNMTVAARATADRKVLAHLS